MEKSTPARPGDTKSSDAKAAGREDARTADREDAKAADQAADQPASQTDRDDVIVVEKSAAVKSTTGAESTVNPYPNYDMLTVEQLRDLAEQRGVEINRDVERAHLITELRAADTGALSVPARKGAR